MIHVGAQVRELAESKHGLLSTVGVAASNLAVAARGEWICRDADRLRQRLPRVVGLRRFLVRPEIAA